MILPASVDVVMGGGGGGLLGFLVDNIYIVFNDQVFRQSVGGKNHGNEVRSFIAGLVFCIFCGRSLSKGFCMVGGDILM